MENNTTTTTVETTTEPVTEPTAPTTEDVITMSQEDYNKAIQSAADQVRGKMSREIKTLQDKIQELTPVVKTETEIALENRLAALETKERETAEKERLLSLRETLQGSGVDQSIADYLKVDVDTKTFIEALDKVVGAKIATTGYKPSGHSSNVEMTKAEYDKLSYSGRVALYQTDPELVKKFRN